MDVESEFHIGHISYGFVSNMHVIVLSFPFMIVKEMNTVENYYVSWDCKVYASGLSRPLVLQGSKVHGGTSMLEGTGREHCELTAVCRL